MFLSRNAGRRLNPTKTSILKTGSTRNDFLKILKIQQMLFEGLLTKVAVLKITQSLQKDLRGDTFY